MSAILTSVWFWCAVFVVAWLFLLLVERERGIEDVRFVDPFDHEKVLG